VSLVVAVPKYHRIGEGFSPREKLQALEHPGRRTNGTQSAATWITSLTDLRKSIILCAAFCAPKFNPRRHGYRKLYMPDMAGATDGYTHNGRCDNCKQSTALLPGGGRTFVPDEVYRLTCIDPLDARRKARAASRALTAWQRIQRRGSHAPREGVAKGASR